MNTTSPSLLLRLCQSPSAAAWDRFAQLYGPLLLSWAHRLGLAEGDASDLAQEVFVALLEKVALYEVQPGKRFRGWLWTVMVNKWRELRRHRRPHTPLDADVAAPSEAAWEEEDRRHLIGRALRIMQSDFEPITWKACWEAVANDRPAAEVAAELGISVNAVYQAKSRVLRRLHQELAGLWE
jgi:RNA polymerase sigma-70 factor (ECF subfamily)